MYKNDGKSENQMKKKKTNQIQQRELTIYVR